jgi:predicted GIY-YIG superfamily endonuclease
MKYFYAYILQSEIYSDRFYVGFTEDLEGRIKRHNAGESPHTEKYVPWKMKNFFAFDSKQKAMEFEKYLKTSSGRAFSKKHF